jgi:hypothetical protein
MLMSSSCWYKRSEFGIRAAIFFSAAALAGSFGGLLAAGIAKMSGVGGKPGWAWIFVSLFSDLVGTSEVNLADRSDPRRISNNTCRHSILLDGSRLPSRSNLSYPR